tara:strand:- start:19496 stop:20362 length:867 start_codon:yes stop_codon:yes gene_type:complete
MNLPIISRFISTPTNLKHTIQHLQSFNVLPIIDYINENQKEHQINFETIQRTLREIPNIHFAIKLSSLNIEQNQEQCLDYISQLCETAIQNQSNLLIDAENHLLQSKINNLTDILIKTYGDKTLIYKTYQMYKRDSLIQLKKDILLSPRNPFGIKLVRGAYYYQDKSIIDLNTNKPYLYSTIKETHRDYHKALDFYTSQIENYSTYSNILMCATHNPKSIEYARQLATTNSRPIEFAQLMGMSDRETYQLATSGYKVFKYIPFGNLQDTIPYLTRRLYENYNTIKYLI